MATIYAGTNSYVNGGTATIHTGRGALLALLISHSEPSAQSVTLYDSNSASGSVLAQIVVAPDRSPFYMEFPPSFPLRFSTGLTLDAGSCQVSVIASGGS